VVVVLPSPAGVGDGDQHELAVGAILELRDGAQREFRLVATIGLEVVFADAEAGCDLGDALHFRRLGDLDIAGQWKVHRWGERGRGLYQTSRATGTRSPERGRLPTGSRACAIWQL
jgi:hypothetical protein